MATIADAWAGYDSTPAAARDVEVHWQRWRDVAANADDRDLATFMQGLRSDSATDALLTAVFAHSPYLTRCLIGDPAFARHLIENGPDAAIGTALEAARPCAGAESEQALMARLRLAKRRMALTVAMADIASAWPLEKITSTLSDFAETTLRTACRHLLQALHDKGRLCLPDRAAPETGSALFVLGMGKLGARELNYSSDIDLIVLFDQDAAPATGGNVQQVFTRLAHGLSRIIGAQTAQGYVFRTDLRLRPDPASTPPAVSVRSAAIYYRTSARNWERAAMIKARPVAGDLVAAGAFLESLRPFIWRRRLDFAAMQDIRTIKQQIDRARSIGDDALKGHSVKLGRGGIREIEFFVQAQQLVWGGRDPALRTRATFETLDLLVAKGHVAHGAALELKAAYRFLRRLEHRLQMVNDQQTHSLPDSDDALAGIASFMAFPSVAGLACELRAQIATVERHYAGLFEDKVAAAETADLVFPVAGNDPATLDALAAMGYADSERVSGVVRAWASPRFPALRDKQARELLARLTPAALSAFAALDDPDAVLLRFDDFLSRLPAGTGPFQLLHAHPELFGLVAEILGAAPRLATWLTRHPALFDSVLSQEYAALELGDDSLEPELADIARRGLVRLYYMHELGREEMTEQLAEAAASATDLQDLLDVTRRWANDKIFLIGVHMLRGMLSPVEAGHPLSNIADACIVTLLPALVRDFAAEHGRIPGGRCAVVAFGKLGSREMTTNSDLDLLFLYDHAPDASASDGRKPLFVTQYYTRLCRRLISAITAPTGEGRLYEVDLRLRPSGNAGPLACSLEAFERYQRADAWTWEHQALTRARVVHAEDGLGESFGKVREAVLARPRERRALAGDIVDMRERIRRENMGAETTIKHMAGGLLDIEFIAQYLQLLHAADSPAILAGDTMSVFKAAHELDVLPRESAEELMEAARFWRDLQGMMRLTIESETISDADLLPAGRGVGGLGSTLVADALSGTIEETAGRVARHFDALLVSGRGF